MCWDLDNTLVDTGSLLRAGHSLEQAVGEALPVANMVEFYRTLRERLPYAGQIVLSARHSSMRTQTLEWLAQHGLTELHAPLFLVPHAHAKRKIWERLARDAKLVIVDDLCFNHEGEKLGRYHDLIGYARREALAYVGVEEIAQIASGGVAIETVTERTVAAIGSDHLLANGFSR